MENQSIKFEFATATRIIFWEGSISKAGKFAAQFGERAFVVLGGDLDRAHVLLEVLRSAEVVPTLFLLNQEPTVELVQKGVESARISECDLVIGFGGGSALDFGKAISALITNTGDVLSYLEVVGQGLPLTEKPVPYIAIPTTAGTGAEVTRNAVLGVTDAKVKVSLRSPWMLPRLAIIDPALTYSLPPEVTAYTGLDALTQNIEPYLSNQPNPLTDAICREGISRVSGSLVRAFEYGDDPEARQDMALASLFGGLALANSKLGAVHGFAGPIGGMLSAPHGAICARLLPLVMEANLIALRERDPNNPVLSRFDKVARLLMDDATAQADDAVAWIQSLCERLQIRPLSEYGLEPALFPTLIQNAANASSMKGNPIRLTESELHEILSKAL